MNYFKARQRKDGRWDYTCMNDGSIWPVGYCRPYRPFEDKDLWIFGSREFMEKENERLAGNADKYHCDGHATPDEACACYRRYKLDHDAKLQHVEQDKADEMHKCDICGAWCCNVGSIGTYRHWYLCNEHLKPESLEALFGDVGESWES